MPTQLSLSLLSLWSVYVDDMVVGAVCCRIEPPESPDGHVKLYIMTLGVLAAWRRRAIGTHLLRRVLDSLPRYPSVREVYLHVQTSNQEAVGFYKVRTSVWSTTVVHEHCTCFVMLNVPPTWVRNHTPILCIGTSYVLSVGCTTGTLFVRT